MDEQTIAKPCPPPLHSAKAGAYTKQKEDPIDRAIVLAKCAGKVTNAQIAAALGVSVAKVQYTLQSDWAKQLSAQILHQVGEQKIVERLETASNEALDVAMQLMHEAESEAVRAKCAADIIKAHVGQKITIERKQSEAEIDDELKRIDEELNAIGANRLRNN